MSNSSSLIKLVSTISENTQLIEEFLRSNGIPQPSFTPDGPPAFPVSPDVIHVHQARDSLLEALQSLNELVLGPIEYLFELAVKFYDSSSLHAVSKFNVAAQIPVDGEKSYQEIADVIGLDEDRTRRFLHFAMINGIFKEARPGFVSHTALSALMANEKLGVKDMIGHVLDESFPASAKFVESLEKFPHPKNPLVETPFALAFNTEDPFFEYLKKHPAQQNQFHGAMRTLNTSGPFSGEVIAQGYDWSEYSAGTLVDVGGSNGHTALKIADASSIANLIVQDFSAEVVTNAEKDLPEEYHGRVQFQLHSFFTPQPIKNADVYFFRLIFHDWADEQCIDILRNLVPALKNGAKILINEIVLPEPNTIPTNAEKAALVCDMQMLYLIGSRERYLGEWERLFTAADARFKFLGAKQLQGSRLSMIEAKFEELDNLPVN